MQGEPQSSRKEGGHGVPLNLPFRNRYGSSRDREYQEQARVVRTALIASTLLAWVPAQTLAWAANPWVTADSYGTFHVIVSEKAPAADKLAATEFVAYWKQTTGHDIPTANKPGEGVHVWIGREGLPKKLAGLLRLDGLGLDGLCIRTTRDEQGSHLLIAGGQGHGTLYGVYQFFEDYLGVRWLTAEVTHVPDKAPAELPEIDFRYVPPFEYRYTDYVEPWKDSPFERVLRLRQPAWGLFAHTAYVLVPPEKYGREHPEYFSLVEGIYRVPLDFDWRDPKARVAHPAELGQLNFVHPEVINLIAQELKRRIAEQPEARYWSVSPMDWGNYDRSDKSRAIDEQEGTPMGSLLTGVNAVADALAKDHPNLYVETLARGWSRKPPRTLRPRKNVVIRLGPTDCDFSRPLDDPKSPANRRFLDDLAGWSKIADTLFIWDYSANLRNFHTPHPNLHVLQKNLKLYASYNARGVFAQGCPYPGGELGHLRTYLLAKCMWDPNTDLQRHFNEFINLYYREGARYIREYLELITSRVSGADVFMGSFDEARWMDYNTVLDAEVIFRRAFDLVESETIRQRLELAYLPVQCAALLCEPRIQTTPTKFTLLRPPSLTLPQFLEVLRRRCGVQEEAWPPAQALTAQLGGQTPPRTQEFALERLESTYYTIWVIPAALGSVIRWRDNQSGTELLQGFKTFPSGRGMLQDWKHDPGGPEGPVAQRYEVGSRTFETITVRATLPNGLELERAMTLERKSDALRIALTVTNPTDKPIIPEVKLHPEFHAPPGDIPEIWAHDGDRWVRLNNPADSNEMIYGAYVDSKKYNRWAARLSGGRLSVLNTFDPAEVGKLFYFYNVRPDAQHVNLELVMPEQPLPPKGRRTLRTSYLVSSKSPDRL